MKEEWKDIEGYGGMYQVSNKGRVRSWANNRHGKSNKSTILKPIKMQCGYYAVSLGRSKREYIHRLVASAFIPNSKNKPEVNHKDANKLNNDQSNLEWVTSSENKSHAKKSGLIARGEDVSQKLTNTDVRKIKSLLRNTNLYHRQIADKFNVARKTIGNIANNKTWKHIN